MPTSRVSTCMRFLGLLLLVSTVGSTAATADPRPTPSRKPPLAAFDRTTSFQSCQTSTMFACGMRDAGGHTYGTAHERTICTRYTFQPDGTFSTHGGTMNERGTYKLTNKLVTLTVLGEDPGTKPLSFELTLSADGEKLGDMTRQLK